MVEPWVPTQLSEGKREVHYLVAASFALHPKDVKGGSLAVSLRQLRTVGAAGSDAPLESAERRLMTLLRCKRDDLPYHLRQCVSLLRSKEIGIDYVQLWNDLMHWEDRRGLVQRRWAKDFWAAGEQAKELKRRETNAN